MTGLRRALGERYRRMTNHPPRDEAIRYSVDRCNAEVVNGWAWHRTGVREIRVLVDGNPVGQAVYGLERPDLVPLLEGDAAAGRSGFSFVFPDGVFRDCREEAAVTIEFEAADGTTSRGVHRVFTVRGPAVGCRVPGSADHVYLAPFPYDVVAALQAIRPAAYGTAGPWGNQQIRQAVDDVVEVVRQRAPAKAVLRYAMYLRSMDGLFRFVEEHFDRVNRLSAPNLKDAAAFASSAGEMLCMAHHLYVLASYGVRGGLVECGCFKGFSTCCLSQACAAIGMTMDVFDSFAGLPSSESGYYEVGDFCGTADEVMDNLRTFGQPSVVRFHKGFFSETIPTFDQPIACLWMDVDLTSSATDVVQLLPRLPNVSCVFTHEVPPNGFQNGQPVAESTLVFPPIIDAFRRDGRPIEGAYLGGALGVVFDPRSAIRVLGLDDILRMARTT